MQHAPQTHAHIGCLARAVETRPTNNSATWDIARDGGERSQQYEIQAIYRTQILKISRWLLSTFSHNACTASVTQKQNSWREISKNELRRIEREGMAIVSALNTVRPLQSRAVNEWRQPSCTNHTSFIRLSLVVWICNGMTGYDIELLGHVICLGSAKLACQTLILHRFELSHSVASTAAVDAAIVDTSVDCINLFV